MAKVVITLEDTTAADGTSGMTVHWDSETKADDGGPSYAYASQFIEYICSQSNEHAIIDEDTAEIEPPKGSHLN